MIARRTVLHAGLTALAPAGLVAGCALPDFSPPGATTPTPAPLLRPPITYVALGASDAAGIGVASPTRDGWVPVLTRGLPQPARLVNLGIPGVTLAEAAAVGVPPALDAQPHLITVWLVVNDILGRVKLDAYRASLDQLLAQLQAGTAAHIAVGNVPDAPDSIPYLGMRPAERRALTAEWNDAIAAVVRTRGVQLVDLHARWPLLAHPEFIGPDGLHPTEAGYRALAGTFLAALRDERVI